MHSCTLLLQINKLIANVDALIYLFDGQSGATHNDNQNLLHQLASVSKHLAPTACDRIFFVVNKLDTMGASARQEQMSQFTQTITNFVKKSLPEVNLSPEKVCGSLLVGSLLCRQGNTYTCQTCEHHLHCA